MSESAAPFPIYQPAPRPAENFNRLIKRLLDICLSSLALLVLSPVFLWLALRIRRDSPGPVFYRGPRLGKDGRPFGILKFRTMREEPESYAGPRITADDDPRITPLGKWLRDTKLNELPQLWNVLKGDMSLVGPRPEDPEIAAGWEEEVRREVLSVRPGITSPASVLFRDEEKHLDGRRLMEAYLGEVLPSKLRLDQLYVRHHSFSLDLDVIFWTALVLLPRLGSYKPPEDLLFIGPVNRLVHRNLNWFTADTIVSFISLVVVGLIWRSFGPLDVGWQKALVLAIAYAALFSVTGILFKINRISWSQASASEALDLVPAFAIATALALALNHFLPVSPPSTHSLPSGLILFSAVMAFAGFVAVRYRSRLITGIASRWVTRSGAGLASRERVLIIGGGETGQYAAWRVGTGLYADGFEIVGYVDDDLYKQGVRIRGVNVLGRTEDIPSLVQKHDIGIIMFAIHNISASARQRLLQICESTHAEILLIPDLPAALNALMIDRNRRHLFTSLMPSNGKSGGRAEERLPCHLCLSSVSPMRVDEWLAELELMVQSGDLTAAQYRLTDLRQELQPGTKAQLQASGRPASNQ